MFPTDEGGEFVRTSGGTLLHIITEGRMLNRGSGQLRRAHGPCAAAQQAAHFLPSCAMSAHAFGRSLKSIYFCCYFLNRTCDVFANHATPDGLGTDWCIGALLHPREGRARVRESGTPNTNVADVCKLWPT